MSDPKEMGEIEEGELSDNEENTEINNPKLVRKNILDNLEYNWNLKETYKVYKPNVNPDQIDFNIEDKDNYHYIYVCKKGDFVMSPKGLSKYRADFSSYDNNAN
jgi:hypothetical protein